MKEGSIKKIFFKYVSLNIIGMIGLSCYILADTFFIARGIGVNGLTALNLAIPIYSFIHGTGLMFGMGAAMRFSLSKAERTFTQAVCYVFFAACIFVIAGVFFSNQIAVMLGADGDTLQNTNTYLKLILCFSPMFLLNNVVICLVRNDGYPKLSMIAMLLGSISNIVLDYVFIFPCKMGMFGAALATGIAPVISLLILSIHFIKKNNTFYFLPQKIKKEGFIAIVRLGSSSLITEFSSGIVIIIFNSIILKLEGNIGVAAYGIIANIALVVISVFIGIAQGMQPIISFCYRTEECSNLRKVLKYGCITSISVALIVYVVSVIFAQPMVAIFNTDSNVQLAQIAINGIRIYFTAFIFIGINVLCVICFSAVDNPKNAFVISLLRGFVVIIPVTFILSALFGINGVWISVTVTEFMVLLITVHMILRIKKENPFWIKST